MTCGSKVLGGGGASRQTAGHHRKLAVLRFEKHLTVSGVRETLIRWRADVARRCEAWRVMTRVHAERDGMDQRLIGWDVEVDGL
jgi:hypothetical protein